MKSAHQTLIVKFSSTPSKDGWGRLGLKTAEGEPNYRLLRLHWRLTATADKRLKRRRWSICTHVWSIGLSCLILPAVKTLKWHHSHLQYKIKTLSLSLDLKPVTVLLFYKIPFLIYYNALWHHWNFICSSGQRSPVWRWDKSLAPGLPWQWKTSLWLATLGTKHLARSTN